MAEEEGSDRGLTVLSIDGGGIRGLSSLLILKECMTRLQNELGLESMPDVHQHFDFVGGTGTGGISATMLGRLRMPLDRAIEHFARLAKDVFSDKKYFSATGLGVFKSTKMQQALKQIVQEATGDENTFMMDRRAQAEKCKTVVFAMSKHNMNAGIPTAFRSYQATTNQMMDCTIWEALCATTAHPDLFKSIDIGSDALKESFVDGGLGCNNPLAHVLAEVKLIYPGRHVGCVVSIGAGHARTIHIPKFIPFQRLLATNVIVAMRDIAMDAERVAQEMSGRFGGGPGVYFRFNVNQGMQNIELAEWEQLNEVMAHTRGYMRHPEVSDKVDGSVVAIKNRRAVIPVEHIDGKIAWMVKQTSYTGIKVCPQPTPLFVGCERPVQRAVDYLLGNSTGRKVFVIHGLGGAGKTQMALRIVEKTREHWSDIVYADATSAETVEAALKAFAELKGIGSTYQSAIQWLASNQGHWLFVLDNADDPSMDIVKYLPGSSYLSVLITTRNRNVLQLAGERRSDSNVSSMEPEEALQLLLKASRLEDGCVTEGEVNAARLLLQDLGHLPLAIIQVGGYVLRNQCSFVQYREIYRKRPEKLLRGNNRIRGQFDKNERTIFDAWALSYGLLSSLAQRLLWAMSFMQRDRITLAIFQLATLNINKFEPVVQLSSSEQDAYSYVQDLLGSFIGSDGDWDDDSFLTTIGEILSYSLIEYDRVNVTYVLHPLVQSWVRMIAPHPLANLHSAFILAASLSWNAYSEDYALCRSIHLHVMGVLQLCPALCSDVVACFANVLYVNGLWREASPLQDAILQVRLQTLGEEHPDTLAAIYSLALTYHEQGLWEAAEKLYLQVLDARKQVLGEEHPDTLTAMNSLASTYNNQGRYKQAEHLHLQVLDGRKRVLGGDHLDTYDAMLKLASTYYSQGHYKQAEELYLQVLNARKRILGEEHLNTYDAMLKLANTCYSQGRYKQAQELYVQVLDARRRVLREEHPDTLTPMSNIALTYHNQGHYNQAEELWLQVLDVAKRVLSKEHPRILDSMLKLANTYYSQGRYKQAEELYLQVLDAKKRAHGEEHPGTLHAMSNLALTYLNQGHHKQAEELQVQVLDARKRVLGEEHPDTLTATSNLALTYSNQGRHKQAEDLHLQVLAARKRVLGDEHPDSLTALSNLANTYYNQGRPKQAEGLQVWVLDSRKQVLGKEHPNTLSAMNDLANTYCNQGHHRLAEELRVQVLDARKRVLGKDHPDTLTAMNNLAITSFNQGDYKQAEVLGLQVLEARKRVLGKEHPHTLDAMNNLAITYGKLGRWRQVEELQLLVLDASMRVLGKEHPHTLHAMGNLANTYFNQGRHKNAEELDEQVLDTRKRVLGKAHPDTLTAMLNLAITYGDQGRHIQAEVLEEQVLNASKQTLGEEHPDTLDVMHNLAITYSNQGRHKQAEDLRVQVLDASKQVLGEEHPHTLSAMHNLANTYLNQGRHRQAEGLYLQVIDARKRVLGERHPETLRAMKNLAKCYKAMGRRYRSVYKALKKLIKQIEAHGSSHGG